MEIEVGEYVRTFNGLIGKVTQLTDSGNYAIRIYNGAEYVVRAVIAKHSKNIIDLIEVGDYVNGYKVISIDTNAPNDCKECIELDRNNTYEYQWISRNEIKTILTKEQYQANCYTVETPEKSSGNN